MKLFLAILIVVFSFSQKVFTAEESSVKILKFKESGPFYGIKKNGRMVRGILKSPKNETAQTDFYGLFTKNQMYWKGYSYHKYNDGRKVYQYNEYQLDKDGKVIKDENGIFQLVDSYLISEEDFEKVKEYIILDMDLPFSFYDFDIKKSETLTVKKKPKQEEFKPKKIILSKCFVISAGVKYTDKADPWSKKWESKKNFSSSLYLKYQFLIDLKNIQVFENYRYTDSYFNELINNSKEFKKKITKFDISEIVNLQESNLPWESAIGDVQYRYDTVNQIIIFEQRFKDTALFKDETKQEKKIKKDFEKVLKKKGLSWNNVFNRGFIELKNGKVTTENVFLEIKNIIQCNSSFNNKIEFAKAKDSTQGAFETNEKYYALVIGNNNYEHLEKLDAAENDAEVIADVLTNKYGFEVDLLLNADYDTTVNSLFKITSKLKRNDNLLIYYAGHGELDKAENRGYWLPVDASYELRSKWISNQRIVDRIKATKAKHVLLIADSCFSGTLMRSGTTPVVNEAIDEKYIERLKSKKTRLVITSGGNEPVVDSDGGNHSLFALKLIDTLKNNNTVINSQILFENIRRYVVSNADQTPERALVHKTGHDGGDFLFFPKE